MTQNEVKIKKVIGVTGGSGSGKSTFCRYARRRGFDTIDADSLGHKVILKGEPAYEEIVMFFGKKILDDDGEIDRKKLGKLVFADKSKLKTLDGITHKYIVKEIEKRILESKNSIIFIDAALLPSSPMIKICEKIIVLNAPVEQRVDRIALRDGITVSDTLKRFSAQISDEEYAAYADYTIHNNGDAKGFIENINDVIDEIVGET